MSELGQDLLKKKRDELEKLKAQKAAEEDAAKQKARQELLARAGYRCDSGTTKEYAPEGMDWREAYRNGYDRQEYGPRGSRMYRLQAQIQVDLTEEEYTELEALDREVEEMKQATSSKPASSNTVSPKQEENNELSAIPTRTDYDSHAETWLKYMAYVCWIGGLITAIVLSIHKTINLKTGETVNQFNFWACLGYYAAFAMAGELWFCLSELFGNIAAIKSLLRGYTIKKK